MPPSDMSNMLLTQFILLLIFLRVHERLAIRFIVLQLLYSLPVYSIQRSHGNNNNRERSEDCDYCELPELIFSQKYILGSVSPLSRI